MFVTMSRFLISASRRSMIPTMSIRTQLSSWLVKRAQLGTCSCCDCSSVIDCLRVRTYSSALCLTLFFSASSWFRYMAPEVALKQRYDETADVYSFSVLLWQIIAMKDPYEGLSDQAVERKVLYAGYRPKIDPHWSNALRRLMHDCFASKPRRPHMEHVCDVLRQERNMLSDKKLVDEEVVDSARSAMSARY